MVTIFSFKKSTKELERLQFDDLKAQASKRKQLWVDISNPSASQIDTLTEVFKLHPVTVEDIQGTTIGIKYESFDEYTFVVYTGVKKIDHHDAELIHTYNIFFILGKNFLITVHKDPISEISRMHSHKPRLTRAMMYGVDAVFHQILDAEVDKYIPLVNKLFDEIEDIDEQISKNPDSGDFDALFDKKRVSLKIRRLIAPTINVVGRLTRPSTNFIREDLIIYFRDVFDHLLQINERLESSLDLVSATIAQNSSVQANKLNDVIKILTLFTTTMMPLTLVTGIYGMNVPLPGSSSNVAFLFILAMMVLISGVLIWFFYKKGWMR